MSDNDELDAAVTAIRSHIQTGAGVIRSWSMSRLLAGYDQRGAELRAMEDASGCQDCRDLGFIPAGESGRDADGAPWSDEDVPCPQGCALPKWLVAERNDAHRTAEELKQQRSATRQVAELAAEWEHFGLTGAAQRLRQILGEVTS